MSLIGIDTLERLCNMARTTPQGCFVELGVYQGGSALKLAEVAREQGRALHLFDTFCGIPFACEKDQHLVGDFSDTDVEEVKRLIPDAIFHVGVFPDTMPKDMEKIAFLHIDADQYESYKAAFKHFLPLMAKGGVIWFDDVGCLRGADEAVKEQFGDAVLIDDSRKVYVRIE